MTILLKHQPWDTEPSRPGQDPEIEWNMWKTRQLPYHDLVEGVRVVLVSGGGPTRGILTWEVEVTAVAKGRYRSHRDAWRLLAADIGVRRLKAAGVTSDRFLTQSYTTTASAAGWLLGWSYRPIRPIMLPRPHDLRIGRNGWVVTDRLSVGGQGKLDDPLLRKEVELAAMNVVRSWLTDQGFTASEIRNTSANKPYDYEVGPPGCPRMRIEVKGSTGALGTVEVTAGEVESARHGGVPTTLAIVHGIRLSLDATGRWQADGGNLWLVENWAPQDESLTPKRYSYDPR